MLFILTGKALSRRHNEFRSSRISPAGRSSTQLRRTLHVHCCAQRPPSGRRPVSDWSTIRGVTTKEPLWWRIVRKGSSLEVFYSLDVKNFISTRLGYLPLPASVDAGIMRCSPEGAGFESTFEQIRLTQ